MKRSVVIDCDPGIDDALALFMAIASEDLDIKGITTVVGNVSVECTSENARRIVALVGSDIPVAIGAAKPLRNVWRGAAQVHGANGLGNVELPVARTPFADLPAHRFIFEEARRAGGELELITLGPLTNLALAFQHHPDLTVMIKRIWTMGGAMEGGNVTPCAEFNIHSDPHAAQIVFRSGVPLLMCGLDVTNRALLLQEDLDGLGRLNSVVARRMLEMLECYRAFYQKAGRKGLAMHDPFVVACAIDSSIVSTKRLPVDVETQGEFTTGCTVVDRREMTDRERNIEVAYDLDRSRFLSKLEELLSVYEAG